MGNPFEADNFYSPESMASGSEVFGTFEAPSNSVLPPAEYESLVSDENASRSAFAELIAQTRGELEKGNLENLEKLLVGDVDDLTFSDVGSGENAGEKEDGKSLFEDALEGAECFLDGDRGVKAFWAARVVVAYQFDKWNKIRKIGSAILKDSALEVEAEAGEVGNLSTEHVRNTEAMLRKALQADHFITTEYTKTLENNRVTGGPGLDTRPAISPN